MKKVFPVSLDEEMIEWIINQVKAGRLTGAVGPDHGQQLPLFQFKTHILNSFNAAKGLIKVMYF